MLNIFSPLEQFEILPLFNVDVFGTITNATIILILIFLFIFIFF